MFMPIDTFDVEPQSLTAEESAATSLITSCAKHRYLMSSDRNRKLSKQTPLRSHECL